MIANFLSPSVVDILTEMHNLKQENSKLEDTVNELKGHRDHLLRMNRVLAGLHAGNGDCSSSPSCNPSSTDTQQVGLCSHVSCMPKTGLFTCLAQPLGLSVCPTGPSSCCSDYTLWRFLCLHMLEMRTG